MYHEVLNIVYFGTFSVKCKENDLHRKYRLLGVLQKINLLVQFHRQNKIDDCISFTKTWSRVPQVKFLKLFKNKIQKNILKFFSPKFYVLVHIFYCFVLLLLETDGKWENYICTGLEHLIQYKMMFVSTIYVKNYGRRQISCNQSVIFQEKGTILTMCNIYNMNKNKTADI